MSTEVIKTRKTVFTFPFGITATIRPSGAIVTCSREWVRTDRQERGVRTILTVIGEALEMGVEPTVLVKPVVAMVEALRENRVAMI